ncbi:hypothetical protein [Pseudomonas sp. GL-RE-19]|uniref:hypothetical protein n=1 Tax=Pseudomonas sp. GL-RE-19 TaxID=2832389 RepID=UPI001CBAADA0|nr:hypothetical protein [Pseudomonas sp. GL-RE-19]
MTSISGAATAPLPIPFSLNIRATSQRVADKELATQRTDEVARQRAAKRKAQLEVETLALEWSKIMLEKTIYAALDPATDPALAAKLREQILNRGIGRVKDQEGDEDAKKKGTGAVEFLEILAALSTTAAAIPPTHRIERDIGSSRSDDDLQQLLDDIENDE